MITPFEIPWDPEMLIDLRRRLGTTRWADAVTTDWSQGAELGFLQRLVAHWATNYDRIDMLTGI